VTEKNGQDCVYCICGRFQYNAPKTETGRLQRTLASRPGITPSMRRRVFDLCANACVLCGRRAPEARLEIDHMLSREIAERHGFLDDLIDSEHNYAVLCAECNSGDRALSKPDATLIYRVIVARTTA
jgi:hypothetical protein